MKILYIAPKIVQNTFILPKWLYIERLLQMYAVKNRNFVNMEKIKKYFCWTSTELVWIEMMNWITQQLNNKCDETFIIMYLKFSKALSMIFFQY